MPVDPTPFYRDVPPPNIHDLLMTGSKGQILSNHVNFLTWLRNDPRWCGILKYDEFAGQINVVAPIPRQDGRKPNAFRPHMWSDADLNQTREFLQLECFPRAGKDGVQDAISQWAETELNYHPVRQYLDGLRWDGVTRIDNWLITYCGAGADCDEDQLNYIHTVGASWLNSGAARIFDPGCKVDHVMVLEGEQGIGKSSALESLAGDDWFSDSLPHDLAHKDAKDHVRGRWIIELPELSQFRRSEVETVKAFVSRRFERYRPAYGRNEIRYPRQCIFCGTTNDDKYLVDPTGNRRFWPVRCTTINLDGLIRDRDQLWAEAVNRYQAGEKWHLTDRNIITMASSEQAQRQSEDPWDATIQQHLEGNVETTVANILTNVLGKEIAGCNKADEMRVANTLKRLGWERIHTRKGKVWRKRSNGVGPKA